MSFAPPDTAYVALGGNEGDVLQHFRVALTHLEAHNVPVVAVSAAYRTAALLAPDDPGPAADYWNAVCAVHCRLEAAALLAILQQLEAQAGRVRTRRWGSRPLDLDLLVHGATELNTALLTLPHPEIGKRIFVLRPLADIAPALCIPPRGVSVHDLLARHANPAAGILEVRTHWRS